MLRSAASPQVTPTDADLLRRFLQSRDDEAFGRLVARHAQAIRRVAVRATGNASAADDVAQAAFIVLSRRPRAAWISACCRGSALPWLVRTTRYAASTWRRSEARRRRNESAAAAPERVDPSEPGALGEAVAAALARLPRGERKLITLRHLDEKPWADIAHQLGMSPEAARKAAARAMVRLRERLQHEGITVTPAALALALATLGSSAQSASAAATTSAFVIARGVLTMMKIKTAGMAGSAVVAAVMGVGVLGSGFGNGTSSAVLGGAPAEPAALTEPGGSGEPAGELAGEQDRPKFQANEHQPTVTLADGTKITLLAISNGGGDWWHADGAKAQAPQRYLPPGTGSSSMTMTSDNLSILDMGFYLEAPEAGQPKHGAHLLQVLDGRKQSPTTTSIGASSNDGRQSLRVMLPADQDAQTHEAYLCFASGEAQKVGEITNVDDAWVADEGAQKWITLGRNGENIFVEAGKDAGQSSAIAAVVVGGAEHHAHGSVEDNRVVFEPGILRGADRIEIYRAPLDVVHLENLAARPEQTTQPRMAIIEEPMVLMMDGHMVTAAHAAGGVHTTVKTGSGHSHATAGGSGSAATAHGHGGASATAGDGAVTVQGRAASAATGGGTVTVQGRAATTRPSGTRGGQGSGSASGSGAGAQEPSKPQGQPDR